MSPVIALAGNPNSGKTTLFNRLTGLNQRVGNYPGVTVERRAGTAMLGPEAATVIDLPGTYSLISRSRDEAVAFEVLTGRSRDSLPALTIIVVDASNLDRNLYLTLQILELGMPAIVALNMIDLARNRGIVPDAGALASRLGVPVVPIVATEGIGVDELRTAIRGALAERPQPRPRAWRLSDREEQAIATVRDAVPHGRRGSSGGAGHERAAMSEDGEAIWLLSTLAIASRSSTLGTDEDPLRDPGHLETALAQARDRLAEIGNDFPARVIEARYRVAAEIAETSTRRTHTPTQTATDKIDALLLHPVFGALFFLLVMALLFQSIFAWAEPLMTLIEDGVGAAQDGVRGMMPSGILRDLVADGVVGGVGNVLVFIPQIAILFLFIAVLEDSGYLARAAFITDRLMARIGLHGRAFVPLLSGFACAVPAIMAARTIENRKDRLVTILVTPLMSCSARLPVYGIVISALFASHAKIAGFISVGGILLLSMYTLSVFAAIAAAFVLKRTVLKSPTPPFVLELPPYRRPALTGVVRRVLERCRVFVRDAGTVILACSIVLWALLYFPRGAPSTPFSRDDAHGEIVRPSERSIDTVPSEADDSGVRSPRDRAGADVDDSFAGERLRASYAGKLGRLIEPVIAPLGYDWKIGIGLLASFAAREVLVSTLGLVYGVGRDASEASVPLREAIRRERNPVTGKPVYTPLVGLSLMVFFVLACQCMSTVAVVRRESGSWRWPLFMVGYMTALAWIGAFFVYQGGRLLGFT